MRASWLLIALLCFATGFAAPSQAQNLKDWGVLLLHGKSGGGKSIEAVAAALRSEGAKVSVPAMSWVKSYNTYNATLDEIARHISALRAQGAKRIALVGQSLGANVALGYGGRRGGIDAVVAMAPGHQPDRFLRFTADSLERAKRMVAAGRGQETAAFVDVNQGKKFEIRTTAAAYVSFFDPGGPAIMRRNAASLKDAKLLWVIGSGDANAHAVVTGGKTINVEGGHRSTARAGAIAIVAWLKGL
jgi:dienelactone hydrolase